MISRFREKSFEHVVVREFAVEILRTATDEELLTFLLQLVQALRYEPVALAISAPLPTDISANTFVGPDNVSNTDTTMLSSLASPSKDSVILTPNVSSKTLATGDNLSLLARFLIERACASPIVANYLYWYLKVETEDDVAGTFFDSIFESFIIQLSTHSEEAKTWFKRLLALDHYIEKILSCQREARNQGKRKEGKEQLLIKFLEDKQLKEIPGGIGWVPMPLDPRIGLTGLIPSTARMFASAIYPCVIEFVEKPNDPSIETVTTYKLMFKSGDDLRQDQLIMQMISLMDSLLKKVNLDLKLLTYGILAVGQKDGRFDNY
jgi:phosphatidylinositol 3-kinase